MKDFLKMFFFFVFLLSDLLTVKMMNSTKVLNICDRFQIKEIFCSILSKMKIFFKHLSKTWSKILSQNHKCEIVDEFDFKINKFVTRTRIRF